MYHLYSYINDIEILSSELTVSKDCNHLLSERIAQLERNTVSNAQYHLCEFLKINPVPASIGDNLESGICKASCPTDHEVKPDDLPACHHLKKQGTVIVKFKWRKQKHSIFINRKKPHNKSGVLTQLNFLWSALPFGKHVSWEPSIIL